MGGRAFLLACLGACSRPRAADPPSPPSAAAASGAADAARADDLDRALAPVAPRLSPPFGTVAPEATEEPAPRCEVPHAANVFVLPAAPWSGAPLRVLAVSEKPLVAELRIVPAKRGRSKDPPPEPIASSDARRGGPPYFWVAEVAAPRPGRYTAMLVQRACEEGQGARSTDLFVSAAAPREPDAPRESEPLWSARRVWSRAFENMYSAWVEALFDAPESEQPSWPSLQEVLRSPERNLLHDYLGAHEDSANAPPVRPDCADLPYFLRAYFAWKMKLPFGVGECNRGGGGAPPVCKGLLTNEDAPPRVEASAVKQFGAFLRGALADRAHSGSARAPLEEETADYYPVALAWDRLRPGAIFADPYGHVLVLAKRLPQTAERGGVLFAVDGQPDGTVARKRFWRGNFLFAAARELGGPGFKRFRPVVREKGQLVRQDDHAIARSPEYGDVSREVGALDVEGFYDRMEDVLSPRPLDPGRALVETVSALDEQVRTRVKSVENGRQWLASGPAAAPMPDGAEIFETLGPWEDYSTPSRDLRLLIAIDVARGFPARVARRPERYAMPEGRAVADVVRDVERALGRELATRAITYTRSDGAPQPLTLGEVVARAPALEMAYNPNDCVELRWGAAPGSPEAKSCAAQAPPDQRARMESYRSWFHERRRPARK